MNGLLSYGWLFEGAFLLVGSAAPFLGGEFEVFETTPKEEEGEDSALIFACSFFQLEDNSPGAMIYCACMRWVGRRGCFYYKGRLFLYVDQGLDLA